MSNSQDPQNQQSHLKFQMWSTHLTALNTLWTLESCDENTDELVSRKFWEQHLSQLNQSWHVPGTLSLPKPASLLGKLFFPIMKFLVKRLQPAFEQVIQQQNEVNAQLVQTCNSLVETLSHEAVRKVEAQKQFNAHVVQTTNELVDLTASELERLRDEVGSHLKTFQGHLATFQGHLEILQSHIDNRLEQIEPTLQTWQKNIEQYKEATESYKEWIDKRTEGFETALWTYDQRKEALEIEQILMNQKLEQALSRLRSQETSEDHANAEPLPEPERQKDYQYFLFEHRHRGDEDTIKHRLSEYIPYFEGCSNVLDVGCARGEFLELLHEHSIQGTGIDINQHLIRYCEKKALPVKESDALSYLETLDDGTLDGIFIAHMVEHCSIPVLHRLLKLCFDKLQHHKYLIIETPNPQSLYTLSQHFYKDLSHEKPLDPEALLHVFKTIGFQEARIEPKHPFPEGIPYGRLLEEIDMSGIEDTTLQERIAILNENFHQLNALVYGYLDYAIIAKKVKSL